MSDKGEKTCPLCAEEMDLTDQQLKPCKCGYDICVWCWHHIMDMAEKDGTEGRCPACRVPYDKEKIVGMAANCERAVAEISTERKVKSQKTRTKPSEVRIKLSSTRVVQRNLVYVVGLPLNLGDEDLLQHKEYFGRYGKVLKVSMSRTTAGVIQQFPNNTCSVYITYSKEEEAARCIQAVHGFTLEGKPLRACFGTTKYCHAWLRNMPCSNPDCLYLHEIGSQEDSFTKDEIVSAHTRVQEITGATTNMHCRSGSVLPPPLDENPSNGSAPTGKPIVNNSSNLYPALPNSINTMRNSPPNSSSGRPVTLPSGASWGMRASSSQPSISSSVPIDGPVKLKAGTNSVPMAFSAAVASTAPTIGLQSDLRKKLVLKEENQYILVKEQINSWRGKLDGNASVISSSDRHAANNGSIPVQRWPVSKDQGGSNTNIATHKMEDSGCFKNSCSQSPEKDAWDDEKTDGISSFEVDKSTSNGHLSLADLAYATDPEDSDDTPSSEEQLREVVTSGTGAQLMVPENTSVEEQYERIPKIPSLLSSTVYSELDEDVRSFNSQRLKDSEIVTHPSHIFNLTAHVPNYGREAPAHRTDGLGSVTINGNPPIANMNACDGPPVYASSVPVLSNGYHENLGGGNGYLLSNAEKENQMTRSESHLGNGQISATDFRENSIISDILSMDLESDGSLTSHNLARLLSDVDMQSGSLKTSTSWNAQNNNQSRFSFARQEESSNQTYGESCNTNFRQPSFSHNIIESRNQYLDKVGHNSIFGFSNSEEYNIASHNQASVSSNKFSASRAPISAPPGFSMPSRTVPPPPPGFSSFERPSSAFDSFSASRLLDHSLLKSSSPQAPPTGNIYSNSDFEFMDPAILAVGKGRLSVGGNNPNLDMRSNFPSQPSGFDNESARLQLLMQRSSMTPQKSPQNGFSHFSDSYGFYPQHVEQTQASSYSHFSQTSQQQQQPRNGLLSSGHYDGWRDSQHANNLAVSELLLNERRGLNKLYNNGFEDSAFRMPTSTDLYNRSFGM